MGYNDRQQALLKIIAENEIGTQGELVCALQEQGYNVTQATISRDIKDLGLIKTSGKNVKSKYSAIQQTEKIGKLATLFKESVLNMDTAMNLIVIKTVVGGANAACLLLDKLSLPNIVGTLAGDDTILVIVKDIVFVNDIYNTFKEYLEK